MQPLSTLVNKKQQHDKMRMEKLIILQHSYKEVPQGETKTTGNLHFLQVEYNCHELQVLKASLVA
jgi:hypothetical protein